MGFCSLSIQLLVEIGRGFLLVNFGAVVDQKQRIAGVKVVINSSQFPSFMGVIPYLLMLG